VAIFCAFTKTIVGDVEARLVESHGARYGGVGVTGLHKALRKAQRTQISKKRSVGTTGQNVQDGKHCASPLFLGNLGFVKIKVHK
jgi:hypothetical protein